MSPTGISLPQLRQLIGRRVNHQGIACDIELIGIGQINTAYERMLKSDVKYRFVIDMATLKQTNDSSSMSVH